MTGGVAYGECGLYYLVRHGREPRHRDGEEGDRYHQLRAQGQESFYNSNEVMYSRKTGGGGKPTKHGALHIERLCLTRVVHQFDEPLP